MGFKAFRHAVLEAIQRHRSPPDSRLHLLYAPDFDDPLQWISDTRRDTAMVRWERSGYTSETYPRVIEMDCRKVAPYLLETDPSLDDPWLEASITHAYRYTHSQGDTDEGDSDRALCGWIVSPDSPKVIAQQLLRVSRLFDANRNMPIGSHWHDPRVIALLWRTFSAEQQGALLGARIRWIGIDGAGRLVDFYSAHASQQASGPLKLSSQQRQQLERSAVIHEHLRHWHRQCVSDGTPLPHDALETMCRLVMTARTYHLDGYDLQVFVRLATQLPPGAERAPALQAAAGEAAESPGTLFDRIKSLPAGFWQQAASA